MTAESWTTSGSAGSSFFEGWYYKIESRDGQTAVVVIPGVVYGESDSFAFVMFSAPSVMGANRRIALYRRVSYMHIQQGWDRTTNCGSANQNQIQVLYLKEPQNVSVE